MTPAGQDGEGLVSKELVERIWDAWHEAHGGANARMTAALAAVAPDIDQAGYLRGRRDGAQERDQLGRDWHRRLNEVAAERDQLRRAFLLEPMSQLCRDGDHFGECTGCCCLCHGKPTA